MPVPESGHFTRTDQPPLHPHGGEQLGIPHRGAEPLLEDHPCHRRSLGEFPDLDPGRRTLLHPSLFRHRVLPNRAWSALMSIPPSDRTSATFIPACPRTGADSGGFTWNILRLPVGHIMTRTTG